MVNKSMLVALHSVMNAFRHADEISGLDECRLPWPDVLMSVRSRISPYFSFHWNERGLGSPARLMSKTTVDGAGFNALKRRTPIR